MTDPEATAALSALAQHIAWTEDINRLLGRTDRGRNYIIRHHKHKRDGPIIVEVSNPNDFRYIVRGKAGRLLKSVGREEAKAICEEHCATGKWKQ